MDLLYKIVHEIWLVTVAMAPYLLFGFLMAGILSVLISKDFVRKHLAAHEYPREIEFVDTLPMTATGKIIRKELRELDQK